jgi:hypothetical protein
MNDIDYKNFLFPILLSLLLLYPHIFLSPDPPVILIYGLLTSENYFHTPANKMRKIQSATEYTNLTRVFHVGKKCTILNKNKKA